MHMVDVFFYGSYMNLEVLKGLDISPANVEVTSLEGFDLVIGPRANLIEVPGATVWGITARLTEEDVARLYGGDAPTLVGLTYLPVDVVTCDRAGREIPAVTYIAPQMEKDPARADYVQRILDPAEALGFPKDYLEKIRGFLAG